MSFITFDCYGTLIDWESGITGAFARAAQLDGLTLDPGDVLNAYHDIEATVEGGSYRSYREVLREVALGCAGRLNWAVSHDRAAFLAESLPQWPPFADTNPALERLKAGGHRLGILSNVDDDLLEGTLRHFTVEFDLLVTAQQVRSYKPGHPHFLTARDRIGEEHWLHAAQSAYHDVHPAVELGIPVAWVNRKHESLPAGTGKPTAVVETMAGLVEWVEKEG